jgi:hypothetical protein
MMKPFNEFYVHSHSLRPILFSVLLMILCAIIYHNSVKAQPANPGWSIPIDLSSTTGYVAEWSRITADRAGNVHVVFGAWTKTNQIRPPHGVNVIYYRVWDGSKWSDPVDILAADSELFIGNIIAIHDGRLVLLWNDGMDLNISTAAIQKAKDPHAWKTITVERRAGLNSPRLFIDEKRGIWSITFADLSGNYLLQSVDGVSWNNAIPLSSINDPNIAIENGDLCTSPDGSIQTTWVEDSGALNWKGVAVFHGRFNQKTGQVSTREVISDNSGLGPSFGYATTICQNNGIVMIFWNNGVGSGTGRFYQISKDSGITWGPVENAFIGQLSGQTSYPWMVSDSNDRIQLVTAAYGPDRLNIMRYATWDLHSGWSDYISLWSSIQGEHPSIAISNGNYLHLIWDAYNGSIYYSATSIDAKYIPGEAIPTFREPSVTPTILPNQTIIPSNTPLPNFRPNNPKNLETPIAQPILVGTIPVLFLLMFLISYQVRKTFRK